ncbi:MAG: hypothetical protein EH225_01010 [Calditrichaeota bacterium]|nr:hypothetical protein [Calditrichota bacterium]RQW07865.1 MAG: hypothetical protein EH225_01010 [Calditrichota bacterium]
MNKIIVISIILTSCFLFAQTLNELENEFSTISVLMQVTAAEKDSLTKELARLSDKIEQEKNRKNTENHQLRQWFEHVNALSKSLEQAEKKLSSLQIQIHKIRNELDRSYADILDSLENELVKAGRGEEKEEIEKEILIYTEKRISLLPRFRPFSFRPDKVLEIDPHQAEDSLEYWMFASYLNNARKELGTILESIRNTREELEDMVYLQERSKRFLEDIDHQYNFSLSLSPPEPAPTYNAPLGGEPRVENYSLEAQAQSLMDIMNQLTPEYQEQSSYPFILPLDSERVYISMNDYLRALKNSEQLLNNYIKIIDKKLSSP